MRRLKIQFIFCLIFLCIVVAACLASYHYKIPAELWEELVPLPEQGDIVIVKIAEGLNARQAAHEFQAQGALSSGTFNDLARWMTKLKVDRKIRPGIYHVIK